MTKKNHYPIGMPGRKWGSEERAAWLAMQSVKRSYLDEVLASVRRLTRHFHVEPYGALSIAPERYPLYGLRSRNWNPKNPSVLITGGVHGYETSGVQGAIRFAATRASEYLSRFNFVVTPCISPWGYETINRWNPDAIDPNRSFVQNSPAGEVSSVMSYLAALDVDFAAHFDLHETTDTDNTEFRPALAARDAVEHRNWHIPDGFYAVGDSERPAPEFQAAIIRSVEKVTHIAPPDPDGNIIGEKLEQPGVINYAARSLGLCMGMTDATWVTTTEVYPDSPKVDDENCTDAQVAAVTGGLDYIARL
jgi:hypothetical protein